MAAKLQDCFRQIEAAEAEAGDTFDGWHQWIGRRCALEGSHSRLGLLLELVAWAPWGMQARLFLAEWDGCDDAHGYRDDVLELFQNAGLDGPIAGEGAERFLAGLPDVVTVFRGCSVSRIGGISWTTSRTVAEGFARGHRGITVPEPVIVRGTVHKNRILAAITEREEEELLLDWRDVRQMRVAVFWRST
jgi:hypothetical protein